MGKNIAEYESRKRMLCKSLKVSYEFVSCKMCGLQHCISGDSRELWLYCLNSARGFVHFSALKESFMRSHFPFPGWQLACSCVTPFLPPLSLSLLLTERQYGFEQHLAAPHLDSVSRESRTRGRTRSLFSKRTEKGASRNS